MAGPEFAFAAPGTEEMTETATGLGGALIAGVVEGVIVKMAPQLGALETPFTWATLLGVPAVGIAGALFTRGILSNLFQGIAAGGTAIAGYVLPAMIMPEGLFGPPVGRKSVGQPAGVKQLVAGNPLDAPARAQRAAAFSQNPGNPGTRQLPADAGFIPIVTDETVLV